MFKSARWKSDKNKIKGVFKLQFHATQLAQLGGDALMISVIPADVGKPTSRLEKAKVRDGSCYWEKPLYETVKFSQDAKSGKFHEKIYHFVVAKDSSRFGGIGEVSIDFACYAEATKPPSLSLPLKNDNSAAVLHVLIERVQGAFDQRDIDGIGKVSHHDRSLRTYFSNGDLDRSIRGNHTEQDDGMGNSINRDHEASIGANIMLSSSNSSCGLDTPQEYELKNTKLTHASSLTKDRSRQWDLLKSKSSTDDSSTSTIGENSEEGSSEIVIKKLKAKVAALTRQADVSELELQTLRKQIVKEMKKAQYLSREVAILKEERNAFKEECEKHKAGEVKINGMLLIEEGDPWALLDELRQELNHEKDLSSNLQLQLQEMQESNAELVLALKMSKSKSVRCKSETEDDEEQRELEAIVREHSEVKETYLLEQKIIDLYGEIELCKRDKDDLEMQMEQIALDYEILKQENHDMSFKLERSQLQEQLQIQYECTKPYTTVNELEEQVESLERDLKSKSKELSKANLVIKELESHIKNLEDEVENQAREFEIDLEGLMRAKTQQEQRAIHAEESSRKMRLQNANAATRLQEELRRLSQKMASTFEVNEMATKKAVDEANKLRAEKGILKDMIMRVKEDLQDLGYRFQEKQVFLEDQINLKSKKLENLKEQMENITGEIKYQKQTSRTEIQRLNMRIENLESERSKELATDCSENFFLHKEKDLQLEIEELERKLDVLVPKTEDSQHCIFACSDSEFHLR